MPANPIAIIEQQEWLNPIEESVQTAVNKAYEAGGPAGKKVQNALNGTWLGHPLHPVLTDIPIGAWTTAVVLDSVGSKGADTAISLGIAGAVASAATGITDWKDTHGKDRRAGLVHALLNTAALGLYIGSLVARKKGDRSTGKVLSAIGFGIVSASAWIGGELVYRYRDGVDQSREVAQPEDWTVAMPAVELPENEMRRADVNGARVLLLKRGATIHAIGEACSHRGGPLAEGKLEGDCVRCPWHGSAFSVLDGSVQDGPATQPQPTYETRVQNGNIEVKIVS